MDDKLIFQQIKAQLLTSNPKLRIICKKDSALHKFINFLFNLANPKNKDSYINNFHTTIGSTIALCNNTKQISEWHDWVTLCHEVTHMEQSKKYPYLWFMFLYGWPISQGILLLMLIWLPMLWAQGYLLLLWSVLWLILVALHFVPHLPDPFRNKWEFEAYAVSMHLHYLKTHTLTDTYLNSIANNFTSMAYFVMEPNEKEIQAKLRKLRMAIINGKSPVKYHPIVWLAEHVYRSVKQSTCKSS